MSDIQTGNTFSDGGNVTAADLNQAVNGATILPAAITGKTNTAPTDAASFLFENGSGALLRATGTFLKAYLFASSVFTGVFTSSQQTKLSGLYIPSALAADVDNYLTADVNLPNVTTLQISGTAARTITGLAGGADGRIMILHNIGTFNLTLSQANASSLAASQFLFCSLETNPQRDVILHPDEKVMLQYTNGRWRLVGERVNLFPKFASLTDGATVTITCDPIKTVQTHTVTLAGNRTLAISGATNGMRGILKIVQDSTGSRTLTLPATSKVVGGGAGAITLTTAAASIDILSWWYDGSNYFWVADKNFT